MKFAVQMLKSMDISAILILNKIVKAKIILHAFKFIYLSTVTDSRRLEHYARD